MNTMIVTGRTSRVLEMKTVQKPDGTNQNVIYFNMAIQLPYKIQKLNANGQPVIVNGQVVMENATMFVHCKAVDRTAQFINDNCRIPQSNPDGTPCLDKKGNQKYISRHLSLTGHGELYKDDIPFSVIQPVVIKGESYDVTFNGSLNTDKFIYIVDYVEFLDPRPQVQNANINPVNANNNTSVSVSVSQNLPNNASAVVGNVGTGQSNIPLQMYDPNQQQVQGNINEQLNKIMSGDTPF